MLVLNRKLNGKIVINDNIVITVLAIERDRVRLGIDAPADVPVHRSEIQARVEAERRRNTEDGNPK